MVMIPRSFSLYANSAGDKGFVPMSDGFTPFDAPPEPQSTVNMRWLFSELAWCSGVRLLAGAGFLTVEGPHSSKFLDVLSPG